MKDSVYKSYDELPLFLNAKTVARVLGISPSSGYELMHQRDFPTLKIGNRIVVPKERFVMMNTLILENDRSKARTPRVSACAPLCAILPMRTGQSLWRIFCAEIRRFTKGERKAG